jgi:hypothetical protein
MKRDKLYIAILTVIIVYYVLRVFAFLYVFNSMVTVNKEHPKTEQLKHGKSNKK